MSAILGQEVRGDGMGMAFELDRIAFLFSEIYHASPFYSPVCSKLWSLFLGGHADQVRFGAWKIGGDAVLHKRAGMAHSGRHGIHSHLIPGIPESSFLVPVLVPSVRFPLLLMPLHKLMCAHTHTPTHNESYAQQVLFTCPFA